MSENPSVAWGRIVVDALSSGGIDSAVIAPGSRSTPLVVAAHQHPAIDTYSIIDERSAAYFALGRAKRTGNPVAVFCTSGTAGANMHPAVIEADKSRTPLIICTADRPTDLAEVTANQTIEQTDLYGDAVRWSPSIPPASPHRRSLDAIRTISHLASLRSRFPRPGPVHLNIPFRKPLSPAEQEAQRIDATSGRHLNSTIPGRITPHDDALKRISSSLGQAERPLLVAGPLQPHIGTRLRSFAESLEIPLLADPLSGARYCGPESSYIIGGYDAFLDPAIADSWPRPDVILQVGARPTSDHLRSYLSGHDGAHFLIDPMGSYRDPSYSGTEVVASDELELLTRVLDSPLELSCDQEWLECFTIAEREYWTYVNGHDSALPTEGRIAYRLFKGAPEDVTIFVSNSMPIRDVDRFGVPAHRQLTVLGNRGASGIDGITSSALGAASGSSDHTILLTGDLAFYHDMNGLLTLNRDDLDLTIIIVNNEGGGIFHKLPIAEIDPPFTEAFLTPHGLDFSKVADLYDIPYQEVSAEEFADRTSHHLEIAQTSVIDVSVDGAANHDMRNRFQSTLETQFADKFGQGPPAI